MNTKYLIQFINVLSVSALLAGCALTQPTKKEDICTQLKRQIIYNASNPNMEARYSTPAQRAALLQRFKDNGCS